MHESVVRLNLHVPKLCVEEMCSSCVSIVMLQFWDFLWGISLYFIHLLWKCGPLHLKHDPGSLVDLTSLITGASGALKLTLE